MVCNLIECADKCFILRREPLSVWAPICTFSSLRVQTLGRYTRNSWFGSENIRKGKSLKCTKWKKKPVVCGGNTCELMNSHNRSLKSAASVLLVNVWKGESARCHYKAIFVSSWGVFLQQNHESVFRFTSWIRKISVQDVFDLFLCCVAADSSGQIICLELWEFKSDPFFFYISLRHHCIPPCSCAAHLTASWVGQIKLYGNTWQGL